MENIVGKLGEEIAVQAITFVYVFRIFLQVNFRKGRRIFKIHPSTPLEDFASSSISQWSHYVWPDLGDCFVTLDNIAQCAPIKLNSIGIARETQLQLLL